MHFSRILIRPENWGGDDSDLQSLWKAIIRDIRHRKGTVRLFLPFCVQLLEHLGTQGRYFAKVSWFYTVAELVVHLRKKKSTRDKNMSVLYGSNINTDPWKGTTVSPEATFHPNELILSSHTQYIGSSTIIGEWWVMLMNLSIFIINLGRCDVLHFEQELSRPKQLDGCYFYR
jgi:hypothetical protein